MVHFEIKDFKIESTNQMWRPVRHKKTGKVGIVPDHRYKKTKNDLIILFQEQLPDNHKPFSKMITVWISIHTYKDLDNCMKLIIDALQAANVFTNDKFITGIHARKTFAKMGQPESIKIQVEGCPEEDLFETDSQQAGKTEVLQTDSVLQLLNSTKRKTDFSY